MLHACTHAHYADGRSPWTALTPIPEGPKCLCKQDWQSCPARIERTDSDLSEATTPRRRWRESPAADRADRADRTDRADRADRAECAECADRADRADRAERAERAADRAERAAVKWELPTWRRVEEWPAHREASGRLTLRASSDPHAEGMRAVCRIRDGVITLGIERRDAAGEETEELVAEVPAEALAVGLQRGRTNMLMLATVHESKMFDDIYCFCDNSAIRNRWIAIFRRLGVAIFDLQN
jgi:hypothetical protein